MTITVFCAQCKEPIFLSDVLHQTLRRNQQKFFCLWGHNNYFPEGETETDVLRRERDRLKQQAAQLQDSVNYQRQMREMAERRVSAAKGQITRLKNRASAGVCPCCNRTFSQLARHMAAKHKGFVAEEINFDRATVQ